MKWILTNNELPKPSNHNNRVSDTVLIYDGYDIMTGWYHFKNQKWSSFNDLFREDYAIIAWMPIPKPPEKE